MITELVFLIFFVLAFAFIFCLIVSMDNMK